MSTFKKRESKGSQKISTASLPDIVFILLFFFMVTTVMREHQLLVEVELPSANEITRLKKRSLVEHIYIGMPNSSGDYDGSAIQLNDALADIDGIRPWAEAEMKARVERERALVKISLKIDKSVKMKLVTEVKQELRKADALQIRGQRNF